MDQLRQTGRTTRMLEHAKKLCDEGRAVYVIADSLREVNRLKVLLGVKYRDIIKVEMSHHLGNFDWDTMKLKNAHPNAIVLIDHHAIENRWGATLEMLHAYDINDKISKWVSRVPTKEGLYWCKRNENISVINVWKHSNKKDKRLFTNEDGCALVTDSELYGDALWIGPLKKPFV